MLWRTHCLVILAIAVAHGGSLGSKDADKVRAANQAYVSAWLKNDPDAVMATLYADAILIPQGRPPIQGSQAIRAFWWPAGSRTTITSFDYTTDEIGGDGTVAFARGTFRFDYTYESGASRTSRQNSGNYLTIFRRDAAGAWRISHRMWGDTPR